MNFNTTGSEIRKMMTVLFVLGLVCTLSGAAYGVCEHDSDQDGDVDGLDLGTLADTPFDEDGLAAFTAEFGRDDCLSSIYTVDYYLKGNVGDRTYDRIGPTLPCPPVYTFEITRSDFVDAGFNTLAGDLYTFAISHMHNGDKLDNPENWILSFDDGSVITTIGTLSYSALEFIDQSMLGIFDLSGTDWKFILSETSDDGPYDGDRLFIDRVVLTGIIPLP